MYYHYIAQVVGINALGSVIPILYKELANYPKQRDALRCYHELVQTRRCPHCGGIVFYPNEIRLAEVSWHRACLKLSLKH